MAARDQTVRWLGDERDLLRSTARVEAANKRLKEGFAKLSDSASRNLRNIGSTMSSAGRSLTLGFTVPLVGGFVVAAKAAEESQRVTKDTEAVIKSMGGVANVTAKQVADLSRVISRKTGIDDESIQVGQNLLLTFGNIRNEVGKGNDVFNRASQVSVDLAARFKTDIPSAAKTLGKALNDPIGGLTSLRRVGVQFNEQQKTQIRTMVESGDILGAQGVILDELGRQTAGSAAAQATATDKLKVAFGELAERIGEKLLPFIERFANWLTEKAIPAIESVMGWFSRLNPTIQKFALIGVGLIAVLGPLLIVLGAIATAVAAIGLPVLLVVGVLAALTAGVIYAYTHFEGLRNVINGVIDWITGTAVPAIQGFAASFIQTFEGIGEAVSHVMNVIQDIITVAIAIITKAWNLFGQTILGYVKGVWTSIYGIIGGYLKIISGIIKTVLAVINGDWGKAWEGIKQIFRGIWQAIWAILNGFLTVIKAAIANAWNLVRAGTSAAWTAIRDRLTAIWGSIKSIASAAAGWVKDQVLAKWNALKDAAAKIWGAIRGGISAAWEGIKSLVRSGVNAVINVINGLIGGVNWVLGKLGLPKIGTISRVSSAPARSADLNRPTRQGMAAGGLVPVGAGFMTNGPQAVVGEGNPRFPEYVIPTDPKFRRRALGLFGQLGHQLTGEARGGLLLPGMALGGILGGIGDAFKGGFNWAKDKVGSLAGSVFRKALELGFSPFNKIAKAALGRLPNPFGIRDIVQGLRETLWQWVKGADSALPNRDVGGGTARGAGFGGLQPAFAAQIKQLISMYGGYLISGWRSGASQRRLYAAYVARGFAPPRVARPGTSMHERGLAADMSRPYGPLSVAAHKLGLKAPVPGEPWHWQPGWTTSRSLYARGGMIGYQQGGVVQHTGPGFLHAGETVIPAKRRGPVIIIEEMNVTVPEGTRDPEAFGRQVGRGFEDELARRRVATTARIS